MTSLAIPQTGLIVDGSARPNPGKGYWRIVDLETSKTILCSNEFPYTTNNAMEYIGLVRAIHMMLEHPPEKRTPVYSDSMVAIAWVKKRAHNVNLPDKASPHADGLYDLLDRCDLRLSKIKNLPQIIQWDTKAWGENPADFGFKK